MKYISGVVIITLSLISGLFLSTASAQNTSNKGKDFWLAYGNHVAGYGNTIVQKMVIYITSDVNTSGVMEVGGVSIPFQVTANAITNVPVPQSAYIGNVEGRVSNKGIHITSLLPIVVYAHIYDQAVSGATLVLPTNTLGKDYYSLNYEQISNSPNSHSFFFVVATEDNTEIIITPSVDTQGGLIAGKPSQIKLSKGEIYQVFGKQTDSISRVSGNNTQYTTKGTDLTGTRIKSVASDTEICKKIAVFSGSGKTAIGCLNALGYAGSADNLFQQVYPTASWGKTFITVPSKDRDYDVYRIFKSDPKAEIKLNGTVIPATSFINDFYYQFDSKKVNYIESDKPIQAALYTVTQGKSIDCKNVPGDVGDPEMIFLNPLEQTLSQITMYSTQLHMITKHFINIVIPATAASSFKIDGISQAALFKSVPDKPDYSYAQISVNAGTHNLEASEGFNAIAYGFGNFESYGYAAGANVKGLGVEIRKASSKKLVSTVCVNEELNLSVKLNSTTNRILWDLGDGSAPLDILNPVPVDANPIDGLYEYLYPNKVIYTELKDYKIIVTANKISTDGCGSTEVIELQFSSVNLPSAAISPLTQACVDAPVAFKDISSANGRNIVKWLWDFDDGEPPSIEQNPIHIFKKSGTYTVKLMVEGETGCSSDVINQVITIYDLPVANFSLVQPACENKSLTFTDQSTPTQGKIIKWIWDFGDESPLEEKDSNAPITHIFSVAKTYQVKLKVISEYGCESLVFEKSVIINPLPIVDFVLPEVCIEDPFAQFTNVSTISDASVLSYFWDFGDPTSNTNTSQQENPRHRYTIVGDYMVSLTVTSKFGCVIKTDKKFTLNGGQPLAKFSVLNDSQLCSNKKVVFRNESTVDPGTIGKVVWYFGNTNDPTTKLEDDDPFPGKEYSISYDTFYSPAFKKVTVRMLAYSGGICVDEDIQDIILLATPLVSFTPLPNVCQEAAPFKIIQASELSGQTGISFISGPGMSSTGIFNPSVAGVGTHTLQYLFTSNSGCSETISQFITVMPSPVVNAGRDTVMLEGGEIKLYAKASGSNLIYKWFPSEGLSQDDILDPVANPIDNTTYTLTVTSDQGCVSMDNIFIKVLKLPIVPNAFSPNNDGVNDLWNIKYLERYSTLPFKCLAVMAKLFIEV